MMAASSFEDAEFISDRVGFLVEGDLKCLGTIAHLKNKFNVGYELKVNFKPPERRQVYI